MKAIGSDPTPQWALTTLRRSVAQLLEVEQSEVSVTDDILDQGLDSVRLMLLIERLRDQGADVDFLDFAQFTTLADWAQLLGERGFVERP